MRFTISHTFHILFLFLHFFVTQLTCLECRYCSSVDENSDCRDGSVETTRLCTIKGEDHCYEEYIINNVKRDGDYVPLYRRGCAPPDWCLIQQNNHGGALKYCRVCQGDKCNDRRFGAVNSSLLECHACWSSREKGACRYGYKCDFSITCPPGSTKCFEEYIGKGGWPQRYEPFYIRGCSKDDFCDKEKAARGNQLKECRQCNRDLCNTGDLGF